MKLRVCVPAVIFLFLIMCFFVVDSFAQNDPRRCAVVRLRDMPQYNEAFSGFRYELEQKGYDVQFSYYEIAFFEGKEDALANTIRQQNPHMILALGTQGAVFVQKYFSDIPILFSMVLDPVESGVVRTMGPSGANITGISLTIDVAQQFAKLKEVIPDVKKVGLLYDANQKDEFHLEVERVAKQLGLELIAAPVHSESEVSGALNDVLERSDALWATVDTLIYNIQSAKHILLATLKKKRPFMAFSSSYVKAGALLALECDYYDVGRQTGLLGIRILAGEDPGTMPIGSPRKTTLSLNQRTAQIIGISVTDSDLGENTEIFGEK